MSKKKPIVGPPSVKDFLCLRCRHEFQQETDTWGSVYECPNCGVAKCRCITDCPESHERPDELGDKNNYGKDKRINQLA